MLSLSKHLSTPSKAGTTTLRSLQRCPPDIAPDAGYLFLIENLDRPGMIGRIGTFLGEKQINISFMRVGRQPSGDHVLMVLGLDGEIDAATRTEVASIPDIFPARSARVSTLSSDSAATGLI